MTHLIIGADPGPEKSGLVVINENFKVLEHHDQIGIRGVQNLELPSGLIEKFLSRGQYSRLEVTFVTEDVSPRGGRNAAQMFARWGKTILTAKTIGKFDIICAERGWRFIESDPATWRSKFCGAPNASDAQIKACVRHVYEDRGLANGGGKQPAQGIKSKPGPLYGLKGHAWDALGVALTYAIHGGGR
jgi:Holliday junction resolvasome RuvABC endonuclease subunit